MLSGAFLRKQQKLEVTAEQNEYREKLQRIAMQLDNHFDKIDELANSLIEREWVKRFGSDAQALQEYFDISRKREIYQELYTYNIWVDFSKTVVVANTEKREILSYYGWQDYDFFCRGIEIKDTETQEHLLEAVTQTKDSLTILNLEQEEMGVISKRIWNASASAKYLWIFFEWDDLEAYLKKVDPDILSCVIKDSSGEVLWQFSDAKMQDLSKKIRGGGYCGFHRNRHLTGRMRFPANGKKQVSQRQNGLVLL